MLFNDVNIITFELYSQLQHVSSLMKNSYALPVYEDDDIYRGASRQEWWSRETPRRRVRPTSNFTVGHDRTPESAGNASPIDLTGRAD